MTNKPLAGVKVVELGQLIAGPFAGKFFADFGAEVIKIEPPGAIRCASGESSTGNVLWWYVQNRNKKSVTADLRLPEGQEIVRRIVRDADVVIEIFARGPWRNGTRLRRARGGQSGPGDDAALGFGQSGPYRDQTGFGAIAESMGGLRYVTGFPDRPPVRPNLSIGDAARLAARRDRHSHGAASPRCERGRSSGRGQVVDVALYEAVFNMMEGALPEYDLFEETRERTGTNLTGIVPSNTYLTRDAQHIVIGANATAFQAADAGDRA